MVSHLNRDGFYRVYIIFIIVYADHCASRINFRCFGKQAEQFLEKNADEVYNLIENGGDVSLIFDWDGLYAPMAVRTRVNLNHYNGEARLNPTIQNAERKSGIAFIDEAVKLIFRKMIVFDTYSWRLKFIKFPFRFRTWSAWVKITCMWVTRTQDYLAFGRRWLCIRASRILSLHLRTVRVNVLFLYCRYVFVPSV